MNPGHIPERRLDCHLAVDDLVLCLRVSVCEFGCDETAELDRGFCDWATGFKGHDDGFAGWWYAVSDA